MPGWLLLFAQAAASAADAAVPPWLQIGSSVSFGGFTVYLILWHLPKLNKAASDREDKIRAEYRAELAAERESCERRHKESQEAAERRQREQLAELKLVLEVCRDMKHESANLAQRFITADAVRKIERPREKGGAS